MIDRIIAHIAPHLCFGCGKIGYILCDYCKNNVTHEPFTGCLGCGVAIRGGYGHIACQLPFDKSWCVTERKGVIERVINAYKFEYVKSCAETLASVLDATLPVLPKETVIVPIPTISKHIRQRGYDHIDLICRRLARQRKLDMQRLLKRQGSSVQQGATRQQRIKQAAAAFGCSSKLSPDVPYLLVDDVVTTGSTLKYAALQLRSRGAKSVWVAAIARQTLD